MKGGAFCVKTKKKTLSLLFVFRFFLINLQKV